MHLLHLSEDQDRVGLVFGGQAQEAVVWRGPDDVWLGGTSLNAADQLLLVPQPEQGFIGDHLHLQPVLPCSLPLNAPRRHQQDRCRESNISTSSPVVFLSHRQFTLNKVQLLQDQCCIQEA